MNMNAVYDPDSLITGGQEDEGMNYLNSHVIEGTRVFKVGESPGNISTILNRWWIDGHLMTEGN